MENSDVILKSMQEKEEKMLVDLAKILQENGISFYLACGTALGCVRHSGFIPWDDDVDIYVWGRDYERIKNIFLTQETGYLKFHDYSTVKGYPYSFPKIVAEDTILVEKNMEHLDYQCGIYIDVFPLLETSNIMPARVFNEFRRYINYCFVRTYFYKYKGGIKAHINSFIRKIVNPRKFQERLYRLYTKKYKNSEFVVDTGVFGKHALLKKGDFEKAAFLPFNDHSMPLPDGYKNYLTMYYGDYMRLPDVDQRVSNHHIDRLVINGKELI